MPKKRKFHTKKYIAVLVITSFVGISIYQTVVLKEMPTALIALAGVIGEKYFNNGKKAGAKDE